MARKSKKESVEEMRAEEAAELDAEDVSSSLEVQVQELYDLRAKMVSLGVDSISKLDVLIGQLNAEISKA